DLRDDLLGVLRARVVGGDHNHVGQARGDLAHPRAVGAIAVAAGAARAHPPPPLAGFAGDLSAVTAVVAVAVAIAVAIAIAVAGAIAGERQFARGAEQGLPPA